MLYRALTKEKIDIDNIVHSLLLPLWARDKGCGEQTLQ